MKSEKERNAVKDEAKALSMKPAELSDEDLEQVSGGTGAGLTEDEITSRVIGLVRNQLDLINIEIDKDSTIVGDLGADTLDVFDLITMLQEEFGIIISDFGLYNTCTIGDLCDVIARCTNL